MFEGGPNLVFSNLGKNNITLMKVRSQYLMKMLSVFSLTSLFFTIIH